MKFNSKKRKILAILTAFALLIGSIGAYWVLKPAPEASASAANINGTMMQYFEWDLPNDGTLWNKVANESQALADAGFTALWLPPAYKGQAGSADVGYGVYDLYDLGEFNQKGSVRTKYGTKDQYLNAINTAKSKGIQIYADIVMNHRMGADSKETVSAAKVQSNNRNNTLSGNYNIGAWTKFDFPGRANKYSSFKWNANHFDGVDWDDNAKDNSIFRFAGKNWDWEVDTENANYDYLMGADVDFENNDVKNELKNWGEWYTNFANLDGFRLDAVKHIKFDYFDDWITTLRARTGKSLFTFGEYWSGDLNKLTNFITKTGRTQSVLDVPLQFKFRNAANGNSGFDMKSLISGTLTNTDPTLSVSFVDNHDTQPGQSLEGFVQDWFKPLAYTFILTRQEGYPCVFYGDYYGIQKPMGRPGVSGKSFKPEIDKIMQARTQYAYGKQNNYFDHNDIVGWTREGDSAHANSGLAALITDGPGGSKTMYVGTSHAGEVWYDITGNVKSTVTIGSNGNATFSVNGGSHSIWVPQGGQPITQPTTPPNGNNSITVYYKTNWANPYMHYQVASGTWTTAPGTKMTSAGNGYFSTTVNIGSATTLTACFNDGGSTWDSNGSQNYKFNSPGTYTVENGQITNGAPSTQPTTTPPVGNNNITVYYKTGWSNPNIHYQVGTGAWTTSPGVKMTSAGNGYFSATINLGSATAFTACFNDGANIWDSNSGANYKFNSPGTYTVENGQIKSGAPSQQSGTSVTVYYKTGWTNAHIHYQVGNGAWTTAPGVKMTASSNGYSVATIDLGSASSITACFNNGSGTWDSNNGNNYQFNAGTYTLENGVIRNGAP